jgi:ABC-type polysaccharide/polyol phosphate transport system ATPase subunit
MTVSVPEDDAISVAGICKRFRFPTLAKQATLKDVVIGRIRREGGFSVVDALDGVTFSVGRGQTLGVIGRNGSGKTTLMRVLAGILKPDRGQLRMRGSIAPLLGLGTGFNPYLTGRENAVIELLTLGLSRAEARRQLGDIVEFSELSEFIDAPMRTYSSGMTMRLAFAAAIRVDPEILLIDEILAVGDEHFAKKCTTWLADFKRRGKTIVLVSHSAADIAEQCDVALWLENGRAMAFGDTMGVLRAYHQAESGTPVAETLLPPVDSIEAATAMANSYRSRLVGLLPMLRLPLIGYVRQTGKTVGGYEDGWTSGTLDFTIEPLRDVTGWTIRATVPSALAEGSPVRVEVDETLVAAATATAGEIVIRCDVRVAKGTAAKVRIVSETVNHQTLGLSDDVRDIGLRVDEIVFDHDG